MTAPARCFLTGTDTGIGKTFCAQALLHAATRQGVRARAMKPVAAGADRLHEGHYRNGDALDLIAASAGAIAYDDCNPILLDAATAPEIAARLQALRPDRRLIDAAFQRLAADCELCLVEGVGGWLAPLDHDWMQVDLVRQLELPVLLVVGLRLGCLNHALLSERALAADGVRYLGWIGNRVDPDLAHADAYLDCLRRHLRGPCLGVLPAASRPREAAAALDWPRLAAELALTPIGSER